MDEVEKAKEYRERYKQKYPERVLESKRRYRRTHGSQIDEYLLERKRRDPRKRSVIDRIYYLTSTNQMTRKTNCEACGSQKKLLAHHDDYSKPDQVRWLCHKCHHAIHKEAVNVLS